MDVAAEHALELRTHEDDVLGEQMHALCEARAHPHLITTRLSRSDWPTPSRSVGAADAVVVGENVYSERERGRTGIGAAIAGAQRVKVPVFFAVATTVTAPTLATTSGLDSATPEVYSFRG